MRIGVVTDDGETVSAHFGRATHYLVYETEGPEVRGKEMRPKASHDREGADRSPEAHRVAEGPLHERMLANVLDCQVLITRGVGRGMYEAIARKGIRPIVTQLASAEEAVHAYVRGTIDDHPERVHAPHP